MDPQFWHARWQTNQIGFHQGAPNALLAGHFAALGLTPPGRVFVPLCGKSHDMDWLRAQGFEVVGAELSPLAAAQFFAERGLTPKTTTDGALQTCSAAGVTMFVGDIFELTPATLGPVAAIYDRAALVALPPALRARYSAHLTALAGPVPQFIVTFTYDQALIEGPPFSISEAELHAHYGATHHIALAHSQAVPGGMKGTCPATESAWLLTPR
ncbi:thiopurine S-methyltransferase [Acidocella sp.]|uniref:thiopurine S-methyltransferase n=1 Tax=Acidocella sp. TaxID=50710 RepID=UPI0026332C37|nr:thiopurine S-methyltransferase [Acidocella sp.]